MGLSPEAPIGSLTAWQYLFRSSRVAERAALSAGRGSTLNSSRPAVRFNSLMTSFFFALLLCSSRHGFPRPILSRRFLTTSSAACFSEKKVLFVSEKQAALDVVKKRLDKIGLGNPCLELHSNKAKKKEVINELKRTAGLELFSVLPRPADRAALSATRDDLNRYCHAVNEPIGASGERPIDLFGQILPVIARLADVDNPLIDLPESINWNEIETLRTRNLVKA